MTDLAIIIVSWNVKAMLAACLGSVEMDLATSRVTGEIWVVDNASSDGSAEMVRCDFPKVRLIASQTNLGFAGGNNAALRAIGFTGPGEAQPNPDLPQAVLLLNPDTEVHPGALQTLFDFLKQQPTVGVVGAQLVYGDGSFQHSAFALPGLWQLTIELLPVPGRLVESRLNGRYPRHLYEQDQPFEIGHPLGAVMGVRREAIIQVGLLDPAYRMYVEEVDWAKRILAAGWKACCVPQAVITHLGGQSTGQVKTRSLLNLWASRYLFYPKHYAPLKVWLARHIVRLGMRRKIQQDKTALARNTLAYETYTERLRCYQQITEIWQGKYSLS
jgi:GT2 family glycosyltransferase